MSGESYIKRFTIATFDVQLHSRVCLKRAIEFTAGDASLRWVIPHRLQQCQ